MPGDRWHDLAATLRTHPWHVLHFVGHGGYDRELGHGFVVLTGDDGRSLRLSALDLGRAVAQNDSLQAGGAERLRLRHRRDLRR